MIRAASFVSLTAGGLLLVALLVGSLGFGRAPDVPQLLPLATFAAALLAFHRPRRGFAGFALAMNALVLAASLVALHAEVVAPGAHDASYLAGVGTLIVLPCLLNCLALRRRRPPGRGAAPAWPHPA